MTGHSKVGQGVEKHIDDSIRRVYEEALSEDVPDRFKQLLDKLKEQDAEKKVGEHKQ